jgi:hypothetical protein
MLRQRSDERPARRALTARPPVPSHVFASFRRAPSSRHRALGGPGAAVHDSRAQRRSPRIGTAGACAAPHPGRMTKCECVPGAARHGSARRHSRFCTSFNARAQRCVARRSQAAGNRQRAITRRLTAFDPTRTVGSGDDAIDMTEGVARRRGDLAGVGGSSHASASPPGAERARGGTAA